MQKIRLRTLKNLVKWVEPDLRKDWEYLKAVTDNYKEIDGKIHYTEVLDKVEYKLKINKENKSISDEAFINNQPINISEIDSLLDVIADESAFLQNLDISFITSYIADKLNVSTTFKKEVINKNNSVRLKLKSDNIADHAGCCKAMLKELYITFDISLAIDDIGGTGS